MKKIDVCGRLENFLLNFFLCFFYPLLFLALLGILRIVDARYFQDFPLLLRAGIFSGGLFSGATLGYVSATVIFDLFFPRNSGMMEEIVNEKGE